MATPTFKFSYDEDEDAKADELPSDEEGDMPTKVKKPSPPPNPNKVPKIPPPCNAKLQLTNPSSQQSQNSVSPDSNTSNDIEQDIMAYAPNMNMQYHHHMHAKHIPSKSLNNMDQIPKFWVCAICTFAENNLSSPVCGICGALPPEDKPYKARKVEKVRPQKKLQNRKKKLPNPPKRIISPRAYQQNHHQHDLWVNLETRKRHNNHQTHIRTVSEQKAAHGKSNISQILPHFLEEDDEKDSDQQPSYMKKNSIANLVTRNNAISVLNEIPQEEKDLIIKQINRISSKKELQIELYSVKMTLQKKIKFHNTRIIALNKQKSKLKSEYLIQSSLWNKYCIIILSKLCEGYFNKLFTLIDIRIGVEKFYLQCFELKLAKVHIAYNKLDFTIDEWDINDTREYVKTTMFTVSKIRTSPDVHKKKKQIDRLKLSINKLEKKYEEKKEMLNKTKVDKKKRTAYITLYLKQVINEFNANTKNIKLTKTYFCANAMQENFNSFLLDQRVEIGKIVNNWLNFLRENTKNEKEILFKDIYIFIERLINTFCKLYNLEHTSISGKYNYREYCMRFIYSAVLNLDVVEKVVGQIANSEQGKKEYKLLSAHAQYTLFAHCLRLKYGL